MRRTFLVMTALVLGGLALMSQSGQSPALKHHIVRTALVIPMSLAQLEGAADVIAVVRPTGKDDVHWNNASNSRWTSDDGRAMIYNDQQVVVVNLLRGEAPSTLLIRNIGGTVGDTSFELEGLEPLAAGQLYLVFLETVETPTKEGSETAISFVAQEQGVFAPAGETYSNDLGLSVAPRDLRRED